MIRNRMEILGKCSLLVLICGVILSVAGCGSSSNSSSISPSISEVDMVQPTQAEGGSLTVTATLTNTAGVSSVTTSVTWPDGHVDTVGMTPTAGGVYSATYKVPANGTTDPQVYTVSIVAYDKSGKILANSAAKAFTIPGMLTPPKPPI